MNETTIDITAVTKLKHAELWKACKKYGTQAALAKYLGITKNELCAWVNLRRCPSSAPKDRARRDELEGRVLLATGKTLDELFPEPLRNAEAFLAADKTCETTRAVAIAALLPYAERTAARLRYDQSQVDEAIDHEELKQSIRRVVGTLSRQEREVVKLRYGLENGNAYTLKEVGHIFRITTERVRQIEAKAIRNLQKFRRAAELRPFIQ